jgi:hypothetical protein
VILTHKNFITMSMIATTDQDRYDGIDDRVFAASEREHRGFDGEG